MYQHGRRVSGATRGGIKRPNPPNGASHAAPTLAAAGHDYTDNLEEDFPPLPATPSKSPATKKKACEVEVSDSMLAQFEMLKTLINQRADSIESRMILLEEKFERVSADLKAVTTRVTTLEQRVAQVGQPVAAMQRRMDEMETRMRRQNLRLDGIPESIREEDIRTKVISICQKVVPDMKDLLVRDIDVAHRMGRRGAAEEGTRPRTTILHFISRESRDAVWKAARTCPYLQQHGLRFKEDISQGDRERRIKLYPYVRSAREAGKTAYYVGGRAFIRGEGEIIMTD